MTDEEKLEKIKQLADTMYNKMQNLTTDTSGIRKAMGDYHQFIIYQYYKEEPVSEDLEKAANEWNTKASFTPFYMTLDDKGNPNGVKQDYTTHTESFKAGAKWQKEQLIKEAVDGKVIANGMGNPILHLWDKGRHLIGKKVKVVVIKED